MEPFSSILPTRRQVEGKSRLATDCTQMSRARLAHNLRTDSHREDKTTRPQQAAPTAAGKAPSSLEFLMPNAGVEHARPSRAAARAQDALRGLPSRTRGVLGVRERH